MIKNEKNEVSKKVTTAPCDEIFFAGTGCVLLRDTEGLTLYDLQQKKSAGQVIPVFITSQCQSLTLVFSS